MSQGCLKAEDVVDHAGAGVEQPLPQVGRDGGRQQERGEEAEPPQPLAAFDVVGEHREQEGEDGDAGDDKSVKYALWPRESHTRGSFRASR